MQIEGVVAYITGGASGLGEATARELAGAGAKVAILDLQAEKGEAISAELAGVFVECDVADEVAPCPFVVTVYDLSFLRYPEAFRPFKRAYLSRFTAYSVKRAKAVIAISESTRQDVINFLKVLRN